MNKDQIIKLRSEGKSYGVIAALMNCSKSVVAFHCNASMRQKNLERTRKRRASNALIEKTEQFRNQSKSRKYRLYNFRRASKEHKFTWHDILKRWGPNPKCYLTGKQLNWLESDTYSFDHVIPRSRGGPNSLDNLGVASAAANRAKHDLTLDEFYALCSQVLVNVGYTVTPPAGAEKMAAKAGFAPASYDLTDRRSAN